MTLFCFPGEKLIKKVYEALRAGPKWEETLFLITYDEHGGFYDHVVPPHRGIPGDNEVRIGHLCVRFNSRVFVFSGSDNGNGRVRAKFSIISVYDLISQTLFLLFRWPPTGSPSTSWAFASPLSPSPPGSRRVSKIIILAFFY